MLTDQELQSLRNLGNEAEAAADEILQLRAALAQAKAEAETAYDITGHDQEPATDEAVRAKARAEDPGGEDLCPWSFMRGWRAAEDTHGITSAVKA